MHAHLPACLSVSGCLPSLPNLSVCVSVSSFGFQQTNDDVCSY